MSRNGAPKINPTGTRYTRVPVWAPQRNCVGTVHSKPMKGLLAVMGEYIKADYVVKLNTYWKGRIEYADLTCEPPLFEGMT